MTESQPNPPSDETRTDGPRQIDSSDLFRGERSIVIIHDGEQYRLSITRNDRLILQK